MADQKLPRLRVGATLPRGFEPANRNRRCVRKRAVGSKVAIEELWRLSRSADDWILYAASMSTHRPSARTDGCDRLRHFADVPAVGEDLSELVARVDVELCEHLA
jgi:hypothetical protein